MKIDVTERNLLISPLLSPLPPVRWRSPAALPLLGRPHEKLPAPLCHACVPVYGISVRDLKPAFESPIMPCRARAHLQASSSPTEHALKVRASSCLAHTNVPPR